MKSRAWAAIIAAAALAAAGCGRGKPAEKTPPPLREAYSLLDKGENPRAILLLEKVLRADPGNEEARLLLSSAFMGSAGIHIYWLYDAFKDVLFQKPLADNLFHRPSFVPADDTVLPPNFASATPAPLELLVVRLGAFLDEIRKAASYLSRFPTVLPRDWPLLDAALENLNQVTPTKDLRVYRFFVRVVYIRAYLQQEFLADPNFGTQEWACSLDLHTLREGAVWVAQQLSLASDDYLAAFPGRSSIIGHFQIASTLLLDILRDTRENSPAGSRLGILELQDQLRQWVKCNNSV